MIEIAKRINKFYNVEFYFWEEEIDEIFIENKYNEIQQKEIMDLFDGYTEMGFNRKYNLQMKCFIDLISIFYDERDWQHTIEIHGGIVDEKCKFLDEKGLWVHDYRFEFPDTSFTIYDITRIKREFKENE